jgi:hypothetical protein
LQGKKFTVENHYNGSKADIMIHNSIHNATLKDSKAESSPKHQSESLYNGWETSNGFEPLRCLPRPL